MEIWIIRDGEKSGPFHDYEIRRRIGTGDLGPSSPAWHEGLDGWTTLSEIPLFQNEFTPRAAEPVRTESPPPDLTPPPVPGPPRILRRFFARWFDISLYIAVWWFAFWLARRDIGELLLNQFVGVTRLIPWLVIEILLIHRFGTTPGKWLLGIHIRNTDGSYLSLAQSTRRALGAYVVGIGLALPFVVLFCMGLSAYTSRKIGATAWDHIGGHRILSSALSAWKIALFVMLLTGAFVVQYGVTIPHVMKYAIRSLNTPESKPMKEMLEKNPPWSFPLRH